MKNLNFSWRLLPLLLLTSLLFPISSRAGADSNVVYVFSIEEEIANPAWHDTQNAFKQAAQVNASHVILLLNTYGGMVEMADSIRTEILRSPIPVYVIIDNNAASAGALISIACDKIYMLPGSTIGAATVVTQDGKPAIDKYQSYMRSKMRATAEETNRNPLIAEAMVDQDIEIDGIIAKDKLLTFTVSEAITHGFCEAEVTGLTDVLSRNNLEGAQIVTYTPTLMDAITKWLIHPTIHGLLIMVIIGGIYFELQSPGIGFPIAASAIATVLFFAPLYLNGLAENWEIIVFVIGLLLLIAEVFFIPGTGIAGIAGITLVLTGLTLSMLENVVFDFENVQFDNVINALSVVILAMVGVAGAITFLLPKIAGSHRIAHLVLTQAQNPNEGYVGVNAALRDLIGSKGVATTDLHPGGQVKIQDDFYDAIAERGYIEKGSNIVVVELDSAQLKVRNS